MKKELTKTQKYVGVIVLIFVTAFGMQFAMNRIEQYGNEDTLTKAAEQAEEIVKSKIMVQVAGEVANPGVYEAETDMRVQDVIEMAGGMTEKADRDKVNLVAYVKDGQKIDVAAVKEAKATAASKSTGSAKKTTVASGTKTAASAKVTVTPKVTATPQPTQPPIFSLSVNTAGTEDFAAIEGVSREVAEAIVQYRDANGAFAYSESLMDVPGVTLAIYQKIEPFLHQ